MNPFTNRWLALFVVVVFLLGVSELVGTSDQGGVLARFADGAPGDEVAPAPEQPAAVEAMAPPPVFVEDDAGFSEDEEDDGSADGDGDEGMTVEIEIADEAEGVDAEPDLEPGPTIVSSQPPGPPGVFNGE